MLYRSFSRSATFSEGSDMPRKGSHRENGREEYQIRKAKVKTLQMFAVTVHRQNAWSRCSMGEIGRGPKEKASQGYSRSVESLLEFAPGLPLDHGDEES